MGQPLSCLNHDHIEDAVVIDIRTSDACSTKAAKITGLSLTNDLSCTSNVPQDKSSRIKYLHPRRLSSFTNKRRKNHPSNDTAMLDFLASTANSGVEKDEIISALNSSRSSTSTRKRAPTLHQSQTKLFYRDPMDVQCLGLDVLEETSVAGTQIFAARLPMQSNVEEINGPANTSRSNDEELNSSGLLPPLEITSDETCSLLPSHDNSHTKRHKMTHLISRKKKVSKGQSRLCTFSNSSGDDAFVQYPPSPPCDNIPLYPRGCASYLFSRDAVRNSTAKPAPGIVCVDKAHRIYVADIGLTASSCQSIIFSAERASRGSYAAYTYAKQTLGCREYDEVAAACVDPVMASIATINSIEVNVATRVGKETQASKYFRQTSSISTASNESQTDDDNNSFTLKDSPLERRPESNPINPPQVKRDLVLDDREPHIVKYDVSKAENRQLALHTDKSAWTFLIALSEGCGVDYNGGGTYFECIDSTVHLSRGQALIFPGKLRHRGQRIVLGKRFLLVGFLVDNNEERSKRANT